MKITKIDGISHKKYKEKGKLIKSNEIEKDVTEERFNDIEAKTTELFLKTLDSYVKNYEKCEEQNKERREKAKNYFSKVKLIIDNEKITICNENTEKIEIEDFNEYDVRNRKYFNVLNKILNGENYTEEDLEVFENDLQKKLNQIQSIKNSLEENKAHFKKESINNTTDRVKGNNKKSLFYEYYRNSSKHQEYVNNIFEAFDKLYSNSHEDINNLFLEITKDSNDRNIRKIRETYHEILNKNKTEFGEELYKKIQDNINNFDKLLEIEPEIKELTKSQIFYKYYIDKVSLDGTNIKHCFSHLVEIEVNQLLKNYVYSKRSTNKEKLENIFEYCKLRNLVKNKLVNKLNSYIRNCGKYNGYISNNDVVNSEKISEIRTKEAFLRSIIGVSSSAYFSLRNILNTDNTQDITNKVDKEVDKLYQENKKIELEERLKLFFGNYFDINNQQEIEDFLMNIDKIISSIRNEIIHFKMEANAYSIFDFNNVTLGNKAKKILNEEINKEKIKLKIFKQLNSANVFDYLSNEDITEYMGKAVFSFTNRNIPFVPSFTKIYNRVQDLANSLKIEEWKIPEGSEKKDAQIYLLKNIYYGEFLDKFLNEENGIFISIKNKIIELNRNQNKRTGFYKLEKFEKIEEKNPKKYLEIIQSLYMINIEEIDNEEKNIFLDFIQKIFLKGFFEFIKNNYNYLLELKKVQDKKNIFDREMSEYTTGEKTLEDMEEINEITQKIKITEIDKILNQTDKINCFYLLLKLLNYKEITELKGNLEKYQILSNTNIYEKELTLLNIVNLDNNKVKIENFEISVKEIGKFIEKISGNRKIETFEELRNFEKIGNSVEYYNVYSDDKNIKNIRNLYNIKKYGMLDLLEKISEKANYCIKKKNLEEYNELKKQLEDEKTDFYKIQKDLHYKYQKKYKNFSEKNNIEDYKKYKKSIENIEKYVHLKNKIEFNELNLLQSLLLKTLHRLVGFTSIWERDLRFRLTGEFPNELDVEDIFDHRKRYRGNKGQICKKYDQFISVHIEYQNNNKMKNIKFDDNNPIRNYIAHFNYLPTPKYSILKMLEKLRELLDYDRKLKNAVMKSIKGILEEYGFEAEFIINPNKEIILNSIKSAEIIHLKKNDLKSHRNSEDLCKLVIAMLEYSK
ncbi:type VI-A CRISPR-associated RNA-guided ribonuclease Cas13a [Leptotrichia massiliensis]|uniref:type VI-A CRISPR-associated RNA-guided ribonuclease Cas13a n=1 Tax=Leptotrichia massiliensis TaxID=1852388 RepID=UPI0008DA1EDC|nr:type VI-A CRISPR-associated RNA-guided ribonuclease Cas13a [Leptotrichia massiliensis]